MALTPRKWTVSIFRDTKPAIRFLQHISRKSISPDSYSRRHDFSRSSLCPRLVDELLILPPTSSVHFLPPIHRCLVRGISDERKTSFYFSFPPFSLSPFFFFFLFAVFLDGSRKLRGTLDDLDRPPGIR